MVLERVEQWHGHPGTARCHGRPRDTPAPRTERPATEQHSSASGMADSGGRTPLERAEGGDRSQPPVRIAENLARPIRSITPPSIPALVSTELRRRIASGQLEPGPLKISDLALEFGVSAVPVREALRMLEMEGLVTFDHNRSVHVNTLSLDDLGEVYAIRMLLEPLLLARAVPRLARRQGAPRTAREAAQGHGRLFGRRPVGRHEHCLPLGVLRGFRDAPTEKHRLVAMDLRRAVHAPIYATSKNGMGLAQREHRELLKHIKAGNAAKVEEATGTTFATPSRRSSRVCGGSASRPEGADRGRHSGRLPAREPAGGTAGRSVAVLIDDIWTAEPIRASICARVEDADEQVRPRVRPDHRMPHGIVRHRRRQPDGRVRPRDRRGKGRLDPRARPAPRDLAARRLRLPGRRRERGGGPRSALGRPMVGRPRPATRREAGAWACRCSSAIPSAPRSCCSSPSTGPTSRARSRPRRRRSRTRPARPDDA